MNNLFRGLSQACLLLWHWQFFQLAQVLSNKLLPSYALRMNKNILYKLSPKECQPEQKNESIGIFCGDRQSVRDMVRDLYDDNQMVLEFYDHFFEQGAEPWIACQGNTVVGAIWLFSGSYLTMWEGYDAYLLRFHVAPQARFFGNVFVSPRLRGQGLFTLIANSCFTAYPDVDFYSIVDDLNIPSIKSHEKIGFQPYGTIRCIRFFQYTFCMVALKRHKLRFFRLWKGKETDVFLNT
jgi:GNAT superfamily N-acetyltransferase